MPEPLSVSASVAGLISLCAGSARLVFRFVTSIIDAPKEVRGIVTSLNGLNIALCQIQNLLLDLTYSSETILGGLEPLEESVESCVMLLSVVERDLKSVEKAAIEDFTVKKLWHQVKHVFEKESMRDALANLDTQKETLNLVISTLNSKSTANILRLVRNTQSMVHRNHRVLKKLELQVTRVFEDAIGRSHKSQSTVALDSLWTPDEISRILTHHGSTLSLALTEMHEKSASLVVIPDMLSDVGYVSTTLDFPPDTGVGDTMSKRGTIDSFYNIATDSTVQTRDTKSSVSPVQQILAQMQSSPARKSKIPRFLSTMSAMVNSNNPATDAFVMTVNLMGVVMTMINAAQSSAISRSHIEHLEKASARLETLKFITDSKLPIRGQDASQHIIKCQQKVESATKAYVECVQNIYSETSKRAAFVQGLRATTERVETLWAAVEQAMDELDQTVKFALLVELKENTDSAQAESRDTGGMLLDYLKKIEAGQARLEKRLALIDGDLDAGTDDHDIVSEKKSTA